MYCPRCSQQQTSDDIRFCPGCGLQLDLVLELLSNNGALVTRIGDSRKKSLLRRKELHPGGKLMFLSVFLLPVALLLSIGLDSAGPLVVPTITFLIGLAHVLYILLFGEHQRVEMAETRAALTSPANQAYLPAARGLPISGSRRIDTAEMVKPVSVTEHTTKLLDDNR